MTYETIRVRLEGAVCFVQFHRPGANNTISDTLIDECRSAIAEHENAASVFVLEGLPHVFCLGADFDHMRRAFQSGTYVIQDPEPLYDLWLKLATGPFVTIAHVRGRVNAGGVGFVAASDIVIADESARFSLSELLFGLMPACVLPFLIRRVGFQKAHYMTLMTQPVSARQALDWHLVDACDAASEAVLRRYLGRLQHLSKRSVERYKNYVGALHDGLLRHRTRALEANREVFSDMLNVASIARFVETGLLPWDR